MSRSRPSRTLPGPVGDDVKAAVHRELRGAGDLPNVWSEPAGIMSPLVTGPRRETFASWAVGGSKSFRHASGGTAAPRLGHLSAEGLEKHR